MGVTAWAGPVMMIGASAASLGSLLALLAGVSRITLTMARSRDLPHPFGAVGPTGVPVRAQLAVGCAAAVLSATIGDLTVMIAVSGFGVLLYYGLANASAFTQGRGHRRWPRALNIVGVLGCLTLATTLPAHGIALAGLMFVAGLGVREVIRRRSRREGRTHGVRGSTGPSTPSWPATRSTARPAAKRGRAAARRGRLLERASKVLHRHGHRRAGPVSGDG